MTSTTATATSWKMISQGRTRRILTHLIVVAFLLLQSTTAWKIPAIKWTKSKVCEKEEDPVKPKPKPKPTTKDAAVQVNIYEGGGPCYEAVVHENEPYPVGPEKIIFPDPRMYRTFGTRELTTRCVPCIARGSAPRRCLPAGASCKKIWPEAHPQVSDCGACMTCRPSVDKDKHYCVSPSFWNGGSDKKIDTTINSRHLMEEAASNHSTSRAQHASRHLQGLYQNAVYYYYTPGPPIQKLFGNKVTVLGVAADTTNDKTLKLDGFQKYVTINVPYVASYSTSGVSESTLPSMGTFIIQFSLTLKGLDAPAGKFIRPVLSMLLFVDGLDRKPAKEAPERVRIYDLKGNEIYDSGPNTNVCQRAGITAAGSSCVTPQKMWMSTVTVQQMKDILDVMLSSPSNAADIISNYKNYIPDGAVKIDYSKSRIQMMPLFVKKTSTTGKKLLHQNLAEEDDPSSSSNVTFGNIGVRKLQGNKYGSLAAIFIEIAKAARAFANLIGFREGATGNPMADLADSYPVGSTPSTVEYNIEVAQSINAIFGTVSVPAVTGVSGRVNNDGSSDVSAGQLQLSDAKHLTSSLILPAVTPQCYEYTSDDVETCRV